MLSETDTLHLAGAIPSPWQNSLFERKTTRTPSLLVPAQIKFPNPTGTMSVEVCGDWDEWKDKTPLHLDPATNLWTCTIDMKPGHYQCKFLVNGLHWVVTNMLPMLADEGGNNNNEIVVVDTRATVVRKTESAGIGSEAGASPETPPIYKMYYSSAQMHRREFTPASSPVASPIAPSGTTVSQAQSGTGSGAPDASMALHAGPTSLGPGNDQNQSSTLSNAQARAASSSPKKACAGLCSIL